MKQLTTNNCKHTRTTIYDGWVFCNTCDYIEDEWAWTNRKEAEMEYLANSEYGEEVN